MSKRQLFIIIAILVVLDIAAGFWYLAGHINADGNGAVLFDSSDEAVEAADTVAGNNKPDHFETMAAHAYYVSRQPVEEEDASTYLSCIKRFKGRIPVSVNGNKALGELLLALDRKAFDSTSTSMRACVDKFVGTPVFTAGFGDIDYKKIKAEPDVVMGYGYVEGVKVYPVFGSKCFLVMAIDKTGFTGKEDVEEMALVTYDRIHQRVLNAYDMLDMSQEGALLRVLNDAAESQHGIEGGIPKLPQELCPRRNGFYFIFPAGTIDSRVAQVYVPYKKVWGQLGASFRHMVKSNTGFKTYDPVSYR